MDIKKIIQEEMDDFDWAKQEETPQVFFDNILDNHFELVTRIDTSSFETLLVLDIEGDPWITYWKVKKSSTRDLYKILTNTPKYKTMFNKEYKNMVTILEQWKSSRISGMLHEHWGEKIKRAGLANRFRTSDTGPR